MDKHLNQKEQQLQMLLLHKRFEALTEEERVFVLEEMTEADYRLESEIIHVAPELFDETDEHTVPPLLLPAQHKKGLSRQMPVYQTLITVAATVILMWLIIPQSTITKVAAGEPEYVYQTDTVERIVVKHDTIYQTVDKPVYIEKPIYVELTSTPLKEEPRLLNATANIPVPELNRQSALNKGTSLNQDDISTLITTF